MQLVMHNNPLPGLPHQVGQDRADRDPDWRNHKDPQPEKQSWRNVVVAGTASAATSSGAVAESLDNTKPLFNNKTKLSGNDYVSAMVFYNSKDTLPK